MAKSSSSPNGQRKQTNRLNARTYPPATSLDVGEWCRTTQSSTYRQRVKKAVRLVQGYRLAVHGSARLTGNQRDAVHYFLDIRTVDSDRRMNSSSGAREEGTTKSGGTVARDVLGDVGV